MNSLRSCYDKIKLEFPHLEEPFHFVQAVEEHRNFWKPEKVKVLLLAESHVFSEQNCRINKNQLPISLRDSLPNSFARVIYCLASGESELLEEKYHHSSTPQFWKLFYATVNQVKNDADFAPILKTGARDFKNRITNRIELLEKMKESGVWLLDASIVAMYPKENFPSKIRERILAICWENYISQIIMSEQPKKIIVIGKDVSRMLSNQLIDIKMPYIAIKQPQGYRGTNQTEERFHDYSQLYLEVNS